MIGVDPTISGDARANVFRAGRTPPATGAARQALVILALALASAPPAIAAETEDSPALSRRIRWRVASVRIEGARAVPEHELQPLLGTRQRSVLSPWKPRPRFERETLADDTARVSAYYRARGYYRASVRSRVVPRPGGRDGRLLEESRSVERHQRLADLVHAAVID